MTRTLPVDVPARAREASTVVLMREHANGPEVLLVARPAKGAAPGAFVFPGGVLEPGDRAPDALSLCPPESREASRARLGCDSAETALAYWIAACRETFEETGVLMARDARGRPFIPEPDSSTRLTRWREALIEGRAAFAQMLGELGLRPAVEDLTYFSHWITPLALPKRFDTRFFLAECSWPLEAVPDGSEVVEVRWISPQEAMAERNAGSMHMVNATVKTLELLARFGSVADARQALSAANVEAIVPKAVREGEGFLIVNPWEDGYCDLP